MENVTDIIVKLKATLMTVHMWSLLHV